MSGNNKNIFSNYLENTCIWAVGITQSIECLPNIHDAWFSQSLTPQKPSGVVRYNLSILDTETARSEILSHALLRSLRPAWAP